MRARGGVVAQALIGCLTAVMAATGLASPASASAPSRSRPYIVGGADAPGGAWPWIAVLLLRDPSHPGRYFQYCDAALIAPSWVVTAAHCVTGDAPPIPDAIIIGRQSPSAGDGDFNTPTHVVVHPAWKPTTTENDLALIHLAHPSPQTPLPLIRHEQGALWAPGTTAEVIGFGDTDPAHSPSEPATMQQAPQKIIADSTCAQAYPDGGFVASSMMCTENTVQTPCFGDSGGPLMAGDGAGGWREVGLVSHGSSPCGLSPPVYTRLESEIDWIYATINRQVTRLFGADRVATAIAVSKNAFTANSATVAVLANFDSFADALPGTPLAAAKHGPLLLTAGGTLDPRVEAELARVLPSGGVVYVLGGLSALSSTIDTRLGQLGYSVTRYAGSNRFATATMIADLGLGNPATVLEATGLSFADALAGGAAAAAAGGAVLLTNGSSQAAETDQYLTAHSGATRFALGGPAAAADPSATAIVGSDRYATSAAVAQQFFASVTVVGVASGLTFPDALSGGAHIGAKTAPLLLVPTNGLITDSVKTYLKSKASGLTGAFLYGGPSAVSIDIAEDVGTAITAP